MPFIDKLDAIIKLPKTNKEYADALNYANSVHNEIGLLPNMLPGEEKETHSITKSAIANGIIDVENTIGISQINRDIKSSLNKLDTIFE